VAAALRTAMRAEEEPHQADPAQDLLQNGAPQQGHLLLAAEAEQRTLWHVL